MNTNNNKVANTITHNSITLEEFRKHFFDDNYEDKSVLDKVSDTYDKIPALLKVVKNIDPTGMLSSVDEILTENKAKREQSRIIDAIYYLYQYNIEFSSRIQQVIEHNRPQFASITELYFQKCKESIDEEKVKIFASIWFEGVLNDTQTYDEKAHIFALIASLTLDQIKVLKYIYDKVNSDFNYTLKSNGTAEKRPFGIKGFADENNLNYAYVQQICIDLQGKGLMQAGAGSFLSSSPHNFIPTEYVDTLIEYLKQVNN